MLLTITSIFRYVDDAESGAVKVKVKVEDKHEDDDKDNEKVSEALKWEPLFFLVTDRSW